MADNRKGLWTKARMTALYTLSPLHFGVGQVAQAVDLPIARDAATGFPVIPASGVKGAARSALKGKLSSDQLAELFGPELSKGEQEARAGRLTFTEGRLVAYPMRALGQPFLYVTCPMILDRLRRDLTITGADGQWRSWLGEPMPEVLTEEKAGITPAGALDAPLVVEDLVYGDEEVARVPWLERAAALLADLLPETEAFTRQRLRKYLVCLPDGDFGELMQRVVPVRARTQLTDGKTTDAWVDPKTKEKQKGNLWYEEYVPADALFVTFVGERRPGDGATGNGSGLGLDALVKQASSLELIQIGGNETVGYGLCWWGGWQPPAQSIAAGGA